MLKIYDSLRPAIRYSFINITLAMCYLFLEICFMGIFIKFLFENYLLIWMSRKKIIWNMNPTYSSILVCYMRTQAKDRQSIAQLLYMAQVLVWHKTLLVEPPATPSPPGENARQQWRKWRFIKIRDVGNIKTADHGTYIKLFEDKVKPMR